MRTTLIPVPRPQQGDQMRQQTHSQQSSVRRHKPPGGELDAAKAISSYEAELAQRGTQLLVKKNELLTKQEVLARKKSVSNEKAALSAYLETSTAERRRAPLDKDLRDLDVQVTSSGHDLEANSAAINRSRDVLKMLDASRVQAYTRVTKVVDALPSLTMRLQEADTRAAAKASDAQKRSEARLQAARDELANTRASISRAEEDRLDIDASLDAAAKRDAARAAERAALDRYVALEKALLADARE